jgi:inorganic pyrophosphatase
MSEKKEVLQVLIEIPQGSRVKYELDEETGEMTIDRVMPTMMGYPVNYGLIEDTAGEDGDALDALVFISEAVSPGVYIKCKMIGVLEMEDEEGIDHKMVCVPATTKIDPINGAWESLDDVPAAKKIQIKHFFEHYKDLEKDKWVKLNGWHDVKAAEKIFQAGQKRFIKQFTETGELYFSGCDDDCDGDCTDDECSCGAGDCPVCTSKAHAKAKN